MRNSTKLSAHQPSNRDFSSIGNAEIAKFSQILKAFLLCIAVFCFPSCQLKRSKDSALGSSDPDPEVDRLLKLPQFCNPSGKSGVEQKKCYEHNESQYRSMQVSAKEREPWFNFAPDDWKESQEIEERFVIPNLNNLSEALERLEQTPIVELNPSELGQFTETTRVYGGRKPYLVRGLTYYNNKGKYYVYEKDQAIFVRHEFFGDKDKDTNLTELRSAVIIWLPYKPVSVYIDCHQFS